MGKKAKGTFEISMEAEPPYDAEGGVTLGRVSLSKAFVGDLEGTSSVQMLGVQTKVQGSAGYVAIERVIGRLEGRSGSFVLQHLGAMSKGKQQLVVQVVPDSGTGELAGISGQLAIEIIDRQHHYTFDYTL